MATSETSPAKQLTMSKAIAKVGKQFEGDDDHDERQQSSRNKVQAAAGLTSDKLGANFIASPANCQLNFLKCCRKLEIKQTSCKMVRLLNLFTVILLVVCGNSKLSIGRGALALKVTVAIPDLVGLYEGFWLNCSQNSPIFNKTPQFVNATPQTQNSNNIQLEQQSGDQQQERIYSIRWYKDNDEFYRFMPSGEPRALHLEAKGVQADKAKTFEGNVFLVKADLNTEGTYRCEILSEGTFETVSKSKHLRVFALPVKPPRIEILDSNGRLKNPHAQEVAYEVGDKIELRCNSAPSKPPARLRWYLNDREVTSSPFRPLSLAAHKPVGPNYTLSVSPIEYRQHYQTIKSSHSTLSLLLDREDLVYSRLSFKCLAVIRQEISLASKQLILMTSQLTNGLDGTSNGQRSSVLDQMVKHRTGRQLSGSPISAPTTGFDIVDQKVFENIYIDTRPNQMMYIYEDSDTTLGPSITDNPELLRAHLKAYNYGQEVNRQSENLNYIQQLRDRLSRQRSLPSDHQQPGHHTKHRQHYGHYNIVKSPFYPDELDSFRPVINWPPLYSGKLSLKMPDRTIVAIPTRPNVVTSEEAPALANSAENSFEPPGTNLLLWSEGDSDYHKNSSSSRALLDRLIESLNCTCSETNLDTKLKWIINGRDLSELDVRYYPTRVAPDHRQTWMTIGMSPVGLQADRNNDYNYHNAKSSNSLSSILWQNYRLIDAQANRLAQSQAAALRSRPGGGGQQVPVGNEQLKVMCQAQHSMLLYSSSESMTFDFGPNPQEQDGNRIDRFASSPSNVIQAAPSRTKSSSDWTRAIVSTRSQELIVAISIISSIYVMIKHLPILMITNH